MCFNPRIITRHGETFSVGCGKCGECISRRRMEWRQRLYFENKGADRLYFCTFTYNDAHLPRCLGFAVPKVEDVQKFHKRLRRYIDYHKYDIQFKYFVCSEYGPKHFRPHYHGLYCVSGRHTLKFPKIVRTVYNYGFCDVSLCRNRDASTSYITNYLTQTKGNPYFGKLPNAKYPASYLTRILDEHTNGCVRIRYFDTFYLFSHGLGQKYFQSQIAPIIIHNLKALLKETATKCLNIVRIIKHFSALPDASSAICEPQLWRAASAIRNYTSGLVLSPLATAAARHCSSSSAYTWPTPQYLPPDNLPVKKKLERKKSGPD